MNILMMSLGLNLSGQSVHIRNLGKGLIARGHNVIVGSGDPADGKPLGREYFERAGMKVVPIPVAHISEGVSRYASASVQAGWSLLRIFREFRPDVVHLHAVTLAGQTQFARLLARRDSPAMVTTFNNESISANKRKLGRLACRISNNALGQRIIAISSQMGESIPEAFGIDAHAIRVMNYSVDESHFMPPGPEQRAIARARFGYRENEVVICCIARLEPRKNQARLIEALGNLIRKGYPVRLLLAGDDIGGYGEHLRSAAESNNCAKAVTFLGFGDPLDVMWASDINALVSVEEGFGLVVIEGAMAGLPPLRSRSAGAEDQVRHGETGFLVDAANVASITAALESLVVDPALRLRMGHAANQAARIKYSLDIMARQAEDIYRDALSGKSAGNFTSIVSAP